MKKTAQNNKRIIFTGGGSAGHVTPNLALIAQLKQEGWQIYYIGSKNGQEKHIVQKIKIPYFSIPTGKLRRYFSWQNFIDPLKIFFGIINAYFLCWKIRPHMVFSKGGFVAFPVVVAAWAYRIPVIVHESDYSPGLANRLSFPFASKICFTFEDTKKYINPKYKNKLVWSGTPIRPELFKGDAALGRKICGFTNDKKVIFVQGGGLGADDVNKLIRELLPALQKDFQIVHSCGKGKIDYNFDEFPDYHQSEYFHEELPHILACSDLVISRAGANSVHELLALKKPHLLLPLSQKSSRGDQLLNAKHYANLGLSAVIYPEDLNTKTLQEKIHNLSNDLANYQKALLKYQMPNGVEIICSLIKLDFKKELKL